MLRATVLLFLFQSQSLSGSGVGAGHGWLKNQEYDGRWTFERQAELALQPCNAFESGDWGRLDSERIYKV